VRHLVDAVNDAFPAIVEGRIHRVLGLTAESRGLFAPVGACCEIFAKGGQRIRAEVVGFKEEHAIVAPSGDIRGIAAGDRIIYRGASATVRIGPRLIGKVIDSEGNPLDGSEPLARGTDAPLHRIGGNPLLRRRIDRRLTTGIRAIDGLLTVGRGQRMGIFSGGGVGKSTLLGMIARNARDSVAVIGLIGERSREVGEFVDRILGPEGLSRSVVIAATSEEPALKRIQAALVATAVAEYFRDRGEDVILLMDSLTRVANAQREIGLSCGETPTTKGYPASAFTLIPKLLERAGPASKGSITGFYSVLVEADDRNDPVADCARSALDGHLWLSRDAAERGLFPAIDPLGSLSRVQPGIVDAGHLAAAVRIKALIARYRQVEDIVRLGAHVPGADPAADEAIRLYPDIEEWLRQDRAECSDFDRTLEKLRDLAGGGAVSAS
jgi:FliI/YscN family ATPase